MAFQIKNANSITSSMIAFISAVTNKITDFNVGSVSRTMLEATSIELEEIYIRMWEGLTEAIDTAVFKTFDFPRLAAAKSSGPLTFTRTLPAVSDITISAGTLVKVPSEDKNYTLTATVTLLTGQTEITGVVQATQAGERLNTAAEHLWAVGVNNYPPSLVTVAPNVRNVPFDRTFFLNSAVYLVEPTSKE